MRGPNTRPGGQDVVGDFDPQDDTTIRIAEAVGDESSPPPRFRRARQRGRADSPAARDEKVQDPGPQRSGPPTLLGRTRDMLRQTWRDVIGVARVRLTGNVRPDLPDDDLARLRRQVDACLQTRGGEVTARARAADIGRVYLDLEDKGKLRFLAMLAQDYGVDRGLLTQAMAAVQLADSDGDFLAAETQLRRILVPPRVALLKHFNGLSEGVKFLVDMRADVIRFLKTDQVLRPLDRDMRDLLTSWFDVGFLDLRRITWDAPAALLEKLVAYEAVHEIRSWDDLKNRLESDRRCYAFIHPSMPSEPLIFVEIALVDGMASDVQTLLDAQAPEQDPSSANTAIFYSISNTQKGLAGVSFGNFLIKQVVADLSRDFANLKTFATLSPIPGFRTWLEGSIDDNAPVLTSAEIRSLRAVTGGVGRGGDFIAAIDRPDWPHDPKLAETLQPVLLRLCAAYLLREGAADGVVDPVAHFHLTNGARIERINWLGDRSPKGLRQSCGMMVNYLYKLSDIEANHEAYSGEDKIPSSSGVRALLSR